MPKSFLTTVGALFLGFFVLGSETRQSATPSVNPAARSAEAAVRNVSSRAIAGAPCSTSLASLSQSATTIVDGFVPSVRGASRYSHHRSGAPPLA